MRCVYGTYIAFIKLTKFTTSHTILTGFITNEKNINDLFYCLGNVRTASER